MLYLDDNPGRTAVVNGKEYLFFSGYSYLGMEKHPEFIHHVKNGIDKYGVLFPSSRISNTRLHLFDELESYLSSLIHTESTVTYSSGFLAGKAISALLSEQGKIFQAPGSHPSISDGNYSSKSFHEWAEVLLAEINNSVERSCTIVCDAVNIMKSNVNDLSFLSRLANDIKITCLIDLSHAIGVFGSENNDIINSLPVRNNISYIFNYSLSKAFHIEGGAVSCSDAIAEKLRSRADYRGSTAMSPALVYAFMQSRELYEVQQKQLQNNISYFRSLTGEFPIISSDPRLPVFILHKEDVAGRLLEKGIIISSFAYPTPSSPPVSRIILNSLHTENDLAFLAEALSGVG